MTFERGKKKEDSSVFIIKNANQQEGKTEPDEHMVLKAATDGAERGTR